MNSAKRSHRIKEIIMSKHCLICEITEKELEKLDKFRLIGCASPLTLHHIDDYNIDLCSNCLDMMKDQIWTILTIKSNQKSLKKKPLTFKKSLKFFQSSMCPVVLHDIRMILDGFITIYEEFLKAVEQMKEHEDTSTTTQDGNRIILASKISLLSEMFNKKSFNITEQQITDQDSDITIYVNNIAILNKECKGLSTNDILNNLFSYKTGEQFVAHLSVDMRTEHLPLPFPNAEFIMSIDVCNDLVNIPDLLKNPSDTSGLHPTGGFKID